MANQSMPNKILDNNLKNLYNEDFYQWIQTTIKLLKEGKLDEVDRENLIEEIEDIGIREKEDIDNSLIVLLTQLLKYKYSQNNISGEELYQFSKTMIDLEQENSEMRIENVW